MSRSRVACTLLVLLVAATFCTPGAWAAPAREAREADSLNLLVRLWEAVVEILAPAPAPTTDEGCAIDPHGGCKPGS